MTNCLLRGGFAKRQSPQNPRSPPPGLVQLPAKRGAGMNVAHMTLAKVKTKTLPRLFETTPPLPPTPILVLASVSSNVGLARQRGKIVDGHRQEPLS